MIGQAYLAPPQNIRLYHFLPHAMNNNSTIFDLPFWPLTPLYTSRPFKSHVPNVSALLQLLLIYLTLSCNFLGIEGRNIDQYPPPGRPRTSWHSIAVGHIGFIALLGAYWSMCHFLDLVQAGNWNFLVIFALECVLEIFFKPTRA